MKQCPECKQTYLDETLNYCLDDGSALLKGPAMTDEPATAILPVAAARGDASVRHEFASARSGRRSKALDSLAVLPLENAGSDPEMEYLSDGITESIINNLSQLPKLKVIARSTVFRYKGTQLDAHIVGAALGLLVTLGSGPASGAAPASHQPGLRAVRAAAAVGEECPPN
ncbi:MAG: hypothetical protein ABR530_10635, partial [Pyrinomonadaceae bacterium]